MQQQSTRIPRFLTATTTAILMLLTVSASATAPQTTAGAWPEGAPELRGDASSSPGMRSGSARATSATAALPHLHHAAPADKNLADIHIFTLQKDENSLLLDWFNYHSYLIGNPGNVHAIIDHKSTDPMTVGILADIGSGAATSFRTLARIGKHLFTLEL
jgi:hypothetical protein